MIRNKIKYMLGGIITFCLLFVLIPTVASAEGPEAYDGDIYIKGGKYTIWDGAYEDWEQSETWYDLNKDNPIKGTGQAINKNIYVLDRTEIYFDDLDLGTGGVYIHKDYWPGVPQPFAIRLLGGRLRTKEIKDPSDRYYELVIGNDSDIYVEKDIIGVYLDFCGGKIEVGGDIRAVGIYTGYIETGQKSTLDVKVKGDVQLLKLRMRGGKIQIDGDLNVAYYEGAYFGKEEWEYDSEFNYIISINEGEFITNDSELHVGGNISCSDFLMLLGGSVFANSISMGGKANISIDDKVTLFNTIANPEVEAYTLLEDGEFGHRMYRTTLRGLLPNQQVDLVISYDDFEDYTKEFTATADENGNVYVWLVGNQKLSGTATYGGEEAQVVKAEASVTSGHVDTLVFPFESSNVLSPDTDQDEEKSPTTTEDTNSEGTDPEGTDPEGTDAEGTKSEDGGTQKVITNDSEGIPKTGKNITVGFYSVLLMGSLITIMIVTKKKRVFN